MPNESTVVEGIILSQNADVSIEYIKHVNGDSVRQRSNDVEVCTIFIVGNILNSNGSIFTRSFSVKYKLTSSLSGANQSDLILSDYSYSDLKSAIGKIP